MIIIVNIALMAKVRVRHHVNPLADQTEVSFAGFVHDVPMIIDVGADRGEFTAGLLDIFGDTRNFLVLEIRKPLANKLRKKFAEHDNVAVFDGDAVRNFQSLLQPSLDRGHSIETIYVNFPDPWFKDRHNKRRFVCTRLLDDVKKWLPATVEWVYQTDQKKLFDDTVELLEECGITTIAHFDSPPHGQTTKWEDAKVAAGDTINRMKFSLP